MKWRIVNSRKHDDMKRENMILRDKLHRSQEIIEGRMRAPHELKDTQERLAEVEVKVGKLWALLTTQTPRGEDKLNRYGKMFGGAGGLR